MVKLAETMMMERLMTTTTQKTTMRTTTTKTTTMRTTTTKTMTTEEAVMRELYISRGRGDINTAQRRVRKHDVIIIGKADWD